MKGANFSVFREIVLEAQSGFFLLAQRVEISTPSWAEIDVPTPKASQQRLGGAVIARTKLAVFTIVCHSA